MCIDMCITCVYTHVYAHVYMYVHVYMYTHVHTHVHTRLYACVYACLSHMSLDACRCLRQVAFYDDILSFLKSYGALLNTLKPELLVSTDEFGRLGPGGDRPRTVTAGTDLDPAEAEALHYRWAISVGAWV